jgi:hypothetical protein
MSQVNDFKQEHKILPDQANKDNKTGCPETNLGPFFFTLVTQ